MILSKDCISFVERPVFMLDSNLRKQLVFNEQCGFSSTTARYLFLFIFKIENGSSIIVGWLTELVTSHEICSTRIYLFHNRNLPLKANSVKCFSLTNFDGTMAILYMVSHEAIDISENKCRNIWEYTNVDRTNSTETFLRWRHLRLYRK